MRRREFITALGGAAAWPLAAHAQQPALPVIGFLHIGEFDTAGDWVAGFRQGLKDTGLVEGQNVVVEHRWANDHNDQLPPLVADLIRRKVSVIVTAGGSGPAVAAKAATSTIPIVVAFGADPVKLGLVTSLNRPGGNVTGVTFLTTELAGKRLDLLRMMVPQATTFGYLRLSSSGSSINVRQATVGDEVTQDVLAAARAMDREVVVADANSEDDFEPAFANSARRGVGGLLVGTGSPFTSRRARLAGLAARYKIPAIYQLRIFAVDGGLMTYGASAVAAVRLAAGYVAQILKGTKPADLPVQQSSRFEFVLNLKTAKALGLTVPPTLLALADEVIE